MPRTPEENQRIREAQRAKILESARKVFARKGLEATISDIATEAKISLGLAYRYFPDKDAIFTTLLKQMLPTDATALQSIENIPGTPAERLAILLSGIVESRGRPEILETYQLINHVLLSESASDDIRAVLGKRYQLLLDAMKQLIVEGQATGEFVSGDPDQLVAIISACLDGLTRWAVRDPEQFNAYVPDAEIIMRLVRAYPAERDLSKLFSLLQDIMI